MRKVGTQRTERMPRTAAARLTSSWCSSASGRALPRAQRGSALKKKLTTPMQALITPRITNAKRQPSRPKGRSVPACARAVSPFASGWGLGRANACVLVYTSN